MPDMITLTESRIAQLNLALKDAAGHARDIAIQIGEAERELCWLKFGIRPGSIISISESGGIAEYLVTRCSASREDPELHGRRKLKSGIFAQSERYLYYWDLKDITIIKP